MVDLQGQTPFNIYSKYIVTKLDHTNDVVIYSNLICVYIIRILMKLSNLLVDY